MPHMMGGVSLTTFNLSDSEDSFFIPNNQLQWERRPGNVDDIVSIVRIETAAFILSDSSNIAPGGAVTTAQLTAPAGKTTSDFGGGRIQDDANPGTAVDIGANQYREDEWNIQATSSAVVAGVYEFRIILGTNDLLDTYSVDPQWTITTDVPVTPTPGSLVLQGYAPTVSVASSGGTTVTPSAGSLVLTGFIPQLDQGLTPGTGTLVLTGFIPKLDLGIIPSTGSLVLNGFAPTVALSDNKSVVPTAGSLVLNGFAPTVAATANQFVTPSAGSLVLTGFIPTVAAGGSLSVTPSTGALVLVGYAPTVDNPQSATPTTAALLLAGFAPTITVAPLSTAVSGQFMLLGMG